MSNPKQNNNIVKIKLLPLFIMIASLTNTVCASENTNFNLQQTTIVSSSIHTQTTNYHLNPGLLGEPLGGKTQSTNYNSYSGYNPNPATQGSGSRYIDIKGRIIDETPDSIYAEDIEGTKQGTIEEDKQFTIPNVLLQEGKNEITVIAKDKVGNESPPVNLTVYYDPIPPSLPTIAFESTTPLSPLPISGQKEQYTSLWLNNQEIISSNYPDANEDDSLQHDIETWNASVSLNEGDNALEIYSKDRAGNKSASLNPEILLDAVAGTIEVTSPQDGQFLKDETITVSGTYNEDSPYIEVNGVEASIDEDTKTFTTNIALTEGSNSIQAVLTSLLGNINQDDINVILDTIGPVITSTDPEPNSFTKYYAGQTIELSLEVYDEFFEYLYVDVQLEGESIVTHRFEPGDSLELSDYYAIPEDEFGRKTLWFIVTDSAGNSDSKTVDIFILKRPILP